MAYKSDISMLKVGECIHIKKLDSAVDVDDYAWEEYGTGAIGKHIISLSHLIKDLTVTFILDGYSNGNIYKLVYKG